MIVLFEVLSTPCRVDATTSSTGSKDVSFNHPRKLQTVIIFMRECRLTLTQHDTFNPLTFETFERVTCTLAL